MAATMHNSSTQWRVGVARKSITPHPGVELAGLGYYLGRVWDRVNDQINATALVITDQRGDSVAFAALDVLYADRDVVEAIRSKAALRTGLRPAEVCINCSHTHCAPTLGFFDGAGEIDPHYVENTIETTAAVIAEAWNKREPASLSFGATTLSGFGYNRTRNGPIDERLSVLRADRADGSPLAIAFNFNTHPTVFWSVEPRSVSRDWPGRVVDSLEHEFPGAIGLFLEGSCGDSQPKLEFWNREHYREADQMVIHATKEALGTARCVNATGLSVVEHTVTLPARRWTRGEFLEFYTEGNHRLETGDTTGWVDGIASKVVGFPHRLPERYNGSVERAVEAVARFAVRWCEEVDSKLETMPEGREAWFQGIRIGDVWVVTNPAEFFSSLALEIRERWPHDELMILGYSNGSVSYLPDAYEVDRGSYASLHVPKAIRQLPFTRGAGEAAVEASLSALSEAARKSATAKQPVL